MDLQASTIILISTCIISLFVMYASPSLYEKIILHPYSIHRENKWYTFITSGFIHADIWHLAFNMMSLYFFARQFEWAVGMENFLIIYFASLVISDIPTFIKQKDNEGYRSLGASGAVSAIIYGSILFNPLGTIYIYFIPMPAIVFGVLFLVYGYYMEKRGMDYINHSAHNWGAISGVVLTLILAPYSWDEFIHRLFY
ncbi:MAG: rhomboid family intramembrane serine protease [bacterium]